MPMCTITSWPFRKVLKHELRRGITLSGRAKSSVVSIARAIGVSRNTDSRWRTFGCWHKPKTPSRNSMGTAQKQNIGYNFTPRVINKTGSQNCCWLTGRLLKRKHRPNPQRAASIKICTGSRLKLKRICVRKRIVIPRHLNLGPARIFTRVVVIFQLHKCWNRNFKIRVLDSNTTCAPCVNRSYWFWKF